MPRQDRGRPIQRPSSDSLLPSDTASRIARLQSVATVRQQLNASLVMMRFLHSAWAGNSAIKANAEAMGEIVQCTGAIGAASRWLESRSELLLNRLRASGYFISEALVETRWRLTLGLGSESPSEIGFSLHRTGCPYLPSSSLKGLARETAVRSGASTSDINRLFGTKESPGNVVFGDGFPCSSHRKSKQLLELDVMNPHFPDYYQKSGVWPTEWQNPVPIVFLAVPKGLVFKIWVASRSNISDASTTLGYLIQGLEHFGVGAKKAAGYGWFKAV